MSDNPLDRIPSFDRVSVRAVVVMEGEDPGPLLAAAGIVDPVAVPVVFGETAPDRSFGDGLTPNVSAVVEFDQAREDAEGRAGRQRRVGRKGAGCGSVCDREPSTRTDQALSLCRRRSGYRRSRRFAGRNGHSVCSTAAILAVPPVTIRTARSRQPFINRSVSPCDA